MNAYFFKMDRQEKNNILDQHKQVYDGYVTRYNQQSNEYPLYVQDLANDKNGITLNNKGNVKNYTNVNINESSIDTIADRTTDLRNGTVDLDSVPDTAYYNTELMHDFYPSPNEDEKDYYSAGQVMPELDIDLYLDADDFDDRFEYDIDELEDYSADEIREDLDLEKVNEENVPDLMVNINESLNMFERFKKYN